MYHYAFTLGREPELSTAEIAAVFFLRHIPFQMDRVTATHLFLHLEEELDSASLMQQLGGTVAIAKKINEKLTVVDTITAALFGFQSGTKMTFSLHGDNSRALAMTIKKRLKETGESVRYIEANNTATILHNHLIKKHGDFTVVGKDVFCTEAIQPIEDFTVRDFSRPNVDARSGMLPPKLARMMVNLAEKPVSATLLDPFCGSGTILTEAIALGYTNLIGSDVSEKAITDTTQNIHWIIDHMSKPIPPHTNIFLCDARAINQKIPKGSVDAIVTEPYLGKPLTGRESPSALLHQAKELRLLYAEAFRSFASVLKRQGVIICIIPSFREPKGWTELHMEEEIKRAGLAPVPFSDTVPYLRYHRPTQHLARDIWRFKKI